VLGVTSLVNDRDYSQVKGQPILTHQGLCIRIPLICVRALPSLNVLTIIKHRRSDIYLDMKILVLNLESWKQELI
jgi:hypothetical protein